MGLVIKLSLKGLPLLAEVVTGASFNINQNSRDPDPFKIRAVLSIERFTAGTHKTTNAGTLESTQHRFKVFVILDGDGFHSEGSGHLAGLTHRAAAAFSAALKVSVVAGHFFGTIRKEQHFRLLHLSEGLQDWKEMMGLLFIESVGEEIHFTQRLLNRTDEVPFVDAGDPGVPVGPEFPDDFSSLSWKGFRILEETFKVKDGPFGIGKEIAGNQDLIEDPGLRIECNRDTNQSSGGLQDRG